MSHQHARTSVLVGLTIHTFFDGVAIAAGFLVSTWLGAVMFFAVFLHKLPEGFTVASVVLASGQGKRNAILAAGLLGVATLESRRSEEHTSELSHRCISYAVFCLKKKN